MRKQQQKSKNSHKEQRNKSVSEDYPGRADKVDYIMKTFEKLDNNELTELVEIIKKLEDKQMQLFV